jgi:hypothetical protein
MSDFDIPRELDWVTERNLCRLASFLWTMAEEQAIQGFMIYLSLSE